MEKWKRYTKKWRENVNTEKTFFSSLIYFVIITVNVCITSVNRMQWYLS